tara:strand:+ start:1686 stop:2108 length:423 start_codon:yes stop_codon:yes gene_type:complete
MEKNIELNNLKIIETSGGDVRHFLKSVDNSYKGFGEIYFSFINKGSIKGWKLHTKMTMNLVVPIGEVGFVFFEDSSSSFKVYKIGENNYNRLTVPPNIWFGFKGIGLSRNLVVNLSDIIHDPNESKKLNLEKLNFNWNTL